MSWQRRLCSAARAYRVLEKYDIGSTLFDANAVGEIQFHDGPAPGINSLWVQAQGLVSVSLLQKRLNDLGAGIRIELGTE